MKKDLQELLLDERRKEKEMQQKLQEMQNKEKSKFVLVMEQIGTKIKKISESIINVHKKKLVRGISIGIVGISIAMSTACSNSNKDKEIETSTPSITDESMEEDIKNIEKEGITVTTPSTTEKTQISSTSAPTPQTTTTSTTEIKEPVEKPIEVTPSTTATLQETKSVSTTKIETKPQTTTATKIKEEKEPVIKVEPIKIKDFNEKCELLRYDIEYLNDLGYISAPISDELIENAVREIHSDCIEHDGLEEITASKNAQVNSLLSSIGSVNCATFSAGYMGYIPRIEDGFYISSEVMPESCREFQEKLIQVSENYRYELNQTPVMIEDLTSAEAQQIEREVEDELAKEFGGEYNNDNNTEYNQRVSQLYEEKISKVTGSLTPEIEQQILNEIEYQLTLEYMPEIDKEKYSERYNQLYDEKKEAILSKKTNEKQKIHEENARKAYEKMYKEVMKLVNSKEYEKLTPTEKLVAFTNISGALISGMQEKHIDKFEEFQKGIESSVDEAREDLIVANRMNISQKEALDKIVENNKPQVKQEREDLQDLLERIKELKEEGKVLIK